jgi:2,3-bisphosphoglycerate-independent phosphoglycerate mutase
LEVLGIGEKIKKGDVCFRGNFATVDENLTIIDRRAERIEDTEDLIKSLNRIKIKGVKIIVRKAFGHRIGIIFRGKNLSAKVSSNDPKEVGVKVLKIKGQKKMVKIVNEFLEKARTILENHPKNKKRKKEGKLPANYILLRGAGKFKKVKSFKEKYGLRAAFIAGGTLYKGIGKYLGMEEIKVKRADGTINTNLKGKFLAAKNIIKDYDFIFLHIKACDNLAEDGKFLEKKEFIERIDQNLKPILNLKDVLIVITGDHSTCSLKKSHCNLPNPILIYGAKKDGCKKFSERECKKGKLGFLNQVDIMKNMLNLIK